MSSESIVEYFYGPPSGHRCGYCGNQYSSISQGMWTHSLSVRNYQDLIDRGWRRSGKYCYKPLMKETCCPQYTIKCDALNFKASKSQKKVLKRVNKYLNTGVKCGDNLTDEAGMSCHGSESTLPCRSEKLPEKVEIDQPQSSDSANNSNMNQNSNENISIPPKENKTKSTEKITSSTSESKTISEVTKKLPTPGKGADPSKPKCKKAKALRMEKKMQKQSEQSGVVNKQAKCTEKTLRDFLSDISKNPTHKLEVRLVRSSPRSKEFEETFIESHKVYEKYQMTIHKDDASECDLRTFKQFLVDSPLQEEYDGKLPHGYGSFHQQYLLDGKIIAVGVVDILPESISSVYLYYDPDFSFLCPGTYSALREADFTCQLNSLNQNLKYYYMGFYIHSCPKMKYKGNYNPSYLLCPEVYSWHPIEECTPKLDTAKYCRFAPAGKEDTNLCKDVNKVGILYRRRKMDYGQYKSKAYAEDKDEVLQYANYVGDKCAKNMSLYRS